MKLWAHGVLALAVFIHASWTPLEHYHPEDPGHAHEHHAEAHDAHDEAEGAHVEAPDHDATACFKESVAGERAPETKAQAEAARATPLPVGFVPEPAPPSLTPCSHDPPPAAEAPARAPPVHSCL